MHFFCNSIWLIFYTKKLIWGSTATLPLTFIRFLKMWNDHDHDHDHDHHHHHHHHHLTRSLSDAYGVPTSHQGKSRFARLRMNLGKTLNILKSLFLVVNALDRFEERKELGCDPNILNIHWPVYWVFATTFIILASQRYPILCHLKMNLDLEKWKYWCADDRWKCQNLTHSLMLWTISDIGDRQKAQ